MYAKLGRQRLSLHGPTTIQLLCRLRDNKTAVDRPSNPRWFHSMQRTHSSGLFASHSNMSSIDGAAVYEVAVPRTKMFFRRRRVNPHVAERGPLRQSSRIYVFFEGVPFDPPAFLPVIQPAKPLAVAVRIRLRGCYW